MENNNLLAAFTAYIETLCTSHVEIKHVKDDEDSRHFIELNTDQQMHSLKNICYPLVCMEKLTISYTGPEDSTNKNRYCELMFLESVSDTTDFDTIQKMTNKMERIAEDFIKKFKVDRKNRAAYPFLKRLVISNIELNPIENKSISLYGWLLSFNFELPFIETLEPGRFV